MKVTRKEEVRGIRIAEHNKTLFWWIIFLLIILIGILVYIKTHPSEIVSNEIVGIANPASVYCEENGGTLEIRTDEIGGQMGICILKNGTECEEWKYYRGECSEEYNESECIVDSDCVPASCCHPSSCVSKSFIPDCEEIKCSMECVPNTLDCSQGSCNCIGGKCGVLLN